jgi:hypothetical protein
MVLSISPATYDPHERIVGDTACASPAALRVRLRRDHRRFRRFRRAAETPFNRVYEIRR